MSFLSKRDSVAMSSSSGKGIKISGMILSCRDKGVPNFSGAKYMISYTLIVGNLATVVRQAASSSTVMPLPSGDGVRFVRSNQFAKQKTVDYYRGALTRYYTPLLGGNEEKVKKSVEAVINKDKKQLPVLLLHAIDFQHAAFKAWSGPNIRSGDVITVEVEFNPKISTKDVQDNLYSTGTLVSIDGLQPTVSIYASKKSKDPSNAAATPTTTAATPASGAVSDDDKQDAQFLDVGAVADQQTNEVAPAFAHLLEPMTHDFIHVNFKGDSVKPTDTPYNQLPLEYELLNLGDINKQHLDNPFENYDGNYPRAVLICPLKSEKTENVGDYGILFNPSTPTRRIKDTMETSFADDHRTYKLPQDTSFSPSMPVRLAATIYRKVTAKELTAELRAQYQDVENDPTDPAVMILNSTFDIQANISSNFVYQSGIADMETWADVNAHARIPALAVLKHKKRSNDGVRLDMSPVTVAWYTKQYVQQHGFQIPLAFARAILGNGAKSNGKIEWGKDFEYVDWKKTQVDIVNKSNQLRGQWDLLNASESDAEFAPYLKADAGWQAWVLIVPNAIDFARLKESRKQQFLSDLATIPSLKTPAEGQTFVEKLFNTRFPNDELSEFGTNTRDLRVLVWFLKPDEQVYDPALLATPYWKTLIPAPAPAAAALAPAPVAAAPTAAAAAPPVTSPKKEPKRKADVMSQDAPSAAEGDEMDVEGGAKRTKAHDRHKKKPRKE